MIFISKDKKTIRKEIRLTKADAEKLRMFANVTGYSESQLLRALLNGYLPKARPGAEFLACLRELRSIGNSLVHIRTRAEQLGYADAEFLDEQIQGIYELRRALMQNYVIPDHKEWV